MALGDSPFDQNLDKAWKQFCTQLAEAGESVFKSHNPATEAHRVDAFRFLTQNLGQAFDLALETRDPAFPLLHDFCNPTRKLGGDAADLCYHQAWIDGHHQYRISGNRGSARFINFTVQGIRPDKQPGTDIPSLHEPFGDIPESNLFGHQLESDSSGDFELVIGGPQRSGNWLPSTPDTRKLFIRQGFDRWDEMPAQMTIERLDMTGPRPLPTVATLEKAMEWAGNFLTSMMRDWPDHPYQYSPFVEPERVNTFPPPPKTSGTDDQRRGRAVAHMCWQLADDEALIIEFEAPDSFWMLSLGGVFFNSLDYLYRPVSYTPARTYIHGDGKARFVLCKSDPGIANWLDTQGFVRGNLTFRNLLNAAVVEFSSRVVKFDDINSNLPSDTPSVTAEQRQKHLKTQFDAIRQRYRI